MEDPIGELVRTLLCDGKPSLAWVVRWSAGAAEPVAAAWLRSWSPADMAALLEYARHPESAAARKLSTAPVHFATDYDRARSEAIRRLVREPPTLAELIAARNGLYVLFESHVPVHRSVSDAPHAMR